MKKIIVALLFSLINYGGKCQKVNYNHYHDIINKAEALFFIENNVDSALYYYRQAFADFNYVFVKDPLIAAQIAFYANRPYKEFLMRGFDVGLRIEHLAEIKLFDPVYENLVVDKQLRDEYVKRRQVYLKSIDFALRTQITKEFIFDQRDKNLKNYDQLKFNRIGRLLPLIGSRGFPGAKIIGIDDNLMLSEIGKPEFEADSLFKKYGPEFKYLKVDQEILSTKYIMVVLFHNKCAYRELENSVHELIAKGEVHPREIGFLYDNMFIHTRNKKFLCKRPDPNSGVLKLNRYHDYSTLNCTNQKVDSLRKNWHIAPIAIDHAKKEYEEKYGFQLTFGFWGCM